MQTASTTRSLWLVISGVLALAGLLLLAVWRLPFEYLKPIGDQLARDGSLESFTPRRLAEMKPVFGLAALACFAAVGLVFYYRRWLDRRLADMQLANPRRALIRDLNELGVSLKASLGNKSDLGVLAVIMLLAAVTRGLFLSQPMQHDEAYTFIAFASRPFWTAISDYSLPNNHIFHTVLVYMAYHLLGNQPWIVRLPAYLAGVAVIPLTYGAGTAFYDRKVGLLSAGLVAASPLLIDYSANARGYTLICALTLCAVLLAAFVKAHRNTFTWVLLGLACGLGLYTIPIMLYPAGMVMAWLALSHLFGDTSKEYRRKFWGYLSLACLVLAGLAAVLYTPVFVRSGIGAVVNNSYVRPDDPALSASFGSGLLEQILNRITSTAGQWTTGVPWGFGTLSLIGVIASLALHRRISGQVVPMQAAALLWITIAVSLQRVAPLARVWMFLLPLWITWATAGILGLAHLARLAMPARLHKQGSRVAALAAVILAAAAMAAASPRSTSPGAEEGLALYLRDHIQPGDRVAAQSPVSAPLEYYAMRYGLPLDAFDPQDQPPQKLWVVVSKRYNQALDSVLERRGLEELIPGGPVSPVYRYKHISVYELNP